MADKAKNLIGGVKQVSSPVLKWRTKKFTTLMQNASLPTQEEPQLRNNPIPPREAEPTTLTVELNQQSMRPCS